jgi:hypothetical protein
MVLFRHLSVVFLLFFATQINGQPVPGSASNIIFEDNFSSDTLVPSQWISNVAAEVVRVKDFSGKWMKMHSQGTYMPRLKTVLPESFTVEFDFIYQALGDGNNLTEITLYNSLKGEALDVLFPGNSGIKVNLENFIVSYRYYSKPKMDDRNAGEFRTPIIQANQKAHASIRIQKQRLLLYVNDQKLLDAAKCIEMPGLFDTFRFHFWGSQAEPLIANFKIVKTE